MLSGKPPKCDSQHQQVQLPKNRTDGYKVTGSAKELLGQLLADKENMRADCFSALVHPWSLKGMENRVLKEALSLREVVHMQLFCRANKLKKVAMHIIARSLTGSEVANLKMRFESLDLQNKGYVTYKELKKAIALVKLQGANLNSWRHSLAVPDDLEELLTSLDVNGDKEISYSEFVAATMDQKYYTAPNNCWSAFSAFDTDGNGSISREEIQMILRSDTLMHPEENDELAIIAEADENGDGEIDFQEFVQMMCADNKIRCNPRPVEDTRQISHNDAWCFRSQTSRLSVSSSSS